MTKNEQLAFERDNEKYWSKQEPLVDAQKISPLNDPTLGRKFDSDKTDYSLVPLKSLKEIADILTFGSKKYARENWRYVEDRNNRYWSAAMRHMISWKGGETLDDETGKNHLAHAICCLMFLLEENLENK